MTNTTIPLWVVFGFQSSVVAASFVAVILVLVLQQKSLYHDAVLEKIDLHQQRTESSVISPLTAREDRFKQLNRQAQNTPSMWYADNMTQASDAVRQFNNFGYYFCMDDPLVYSVFQHVRHSSLTDSSGKRLWGINGVAKNGYIITFSPSWSQNESTTLYIHPSYPLQYGITTQSTLLVTHEEWSLSMRKQLSCGWGRGGVTYSTISKTFTVMSGLGCPLIVDSATQESILFVAYSFNVSYMSTSMTDALLSPTTQLLLYDEVSNVIMTTRNLNQPDFNVATLDMWNLTTFPDQQFIGRFREYAEVKCMPEKNCTTLLEEVDSSIVTLRYMTTPYGYKLHLFQITPRSYYFAAGDRAVVIGSVIGVVAAVLVMASCVVIWFAIKHPILSLRANMELAAVMRNDEVEECATRLTEVDALVQSFTQMNHKLLQARAYMPQALLYGSSDGGGEDDGEEDPNEGSVLLTVSFTNSAKGSVSSIASITNPASPRRPKFDTSGPLSTSNSTTQHSQDSHLNVSAGASQLAKNPHLKRSIEDMSLVTKKVSVLVVNSRDTHVFISHSGSAKLVHEQVRLVEAVERCTHLEKGVVDSFQGDHFVITFNAVRSVGTPSKNAALVALMLRDEARREGLALGQFSMGLSVGRALVGNVGSATLKKNCTVGSVYTNAVGLERLAKRVNQLCLTHNRAIQEIESAIYSLRMGEVALSGQERSSLWAVMMQVEGASDEWLYELAEKDKGNPFSTQNAAIEMCVAGQKDDALLLLKDAPVAKADVEQLGDITAGTFLLHI